MTALSRQLLTFVLSSFVLACATGAQESNTATPQPAGGAQPAKPGSGATGVVTNADAKLIADFTQRLDKYMALHESKDSGRGELKETKDPGDIKAAQDVLAGRIQAARKDARHGDIFTPEIQQLFRRMLSPEMKGADAAETKQAIKEDGPPRSDVTVKVNARYPENAPLPTVPPNVLLRLPQLPKGLEYRVIGKDLILRDVNANLIVDFIPNAIR